MPEDDEALAAEEVLGEIVEVAACEASYEGGIGCLDSTRQAYRVVQ